MTFDAVRKRRSLQSAIGDTISNHWTASWGIYGRFAAVCRAPIRDEFVAEIRAGRRLRCCARAGDVMRQHVCPLLLLRATAFKAISAASAETTHLCPHDASISPRLPPLRLILSTSSIRTRLFRVPPLAIFHTLLSRPSRPRARP